MPEGRLQCSPRPVQPECATDVLISVRKAQRDRALPTERLALCDLDEVIAVEQCGQGYRGECEDDSGRTRASTRGLAAHLRGTAFQDAEHRQNR